MGQIEDLRLLVVIVDCGSISKAAAQLRIAKSAVSRRLGLLEDRFGTVLINRQPGMWRITDTGKELYQRAVGVVGDVDEITADFAQTSQTIEGPLSISVPQEFGIVFLRRFLIEFSLRHKNIQLQIEFDNRPVNLARENYDFAIRVTLQMENDTNAKHIGETRHRLYASKSYLDENTAPTSAQELKNHPLLNYGGAKRAEWEFLDDKGKPVIVAFKPVMSSNSGVYLADAARSGLGIVRLPDFVGQPACARGDLIEVLPDLKQAPLKIYLIHSEKRRLNRRMRIFAEEMTVECSNQTGVQNRW